MKKYKSFRESAPSGEKFERDLCGHLQQAGWDAKMSSGMEPRWDIVATRNGVKRTIEAKDESGQGSGNISVEHHQGRMPRPSGILVSESDLWCHKITRAGVFCYLKNDMLLFIDKLKWVAGIKERFAAMSIKGGYWVGVGVRDITSGDNYNQQYIVPIRVLDFGHLISLAEISTIL